jgi:hypothetical protein
MVEEAMPIQVKPCAKSVLLQPHSFSLLILSEYNQQSLLAAIPVALHFSRRKQFSSGIIPMASSPS